MELLIRHSKKFLNDVRNDPTKVGAEVLTYLNYPSLMRRNHEDLIGKWLIMSKRFAFVSITFTGFATSRRFVFFITQLQLMAMAMSMRGA